MKRPNPFLFIFLGFVLKIYGWMKGQKIIRIDKIKAPAIVLSNHTSFYDFVYTTTAVYPKRINYIAAEKMFYDPTLGFFLRLARAIPKRLFFSDPTATIKGYKIVKNGCILGIFPEGQISAIGVTLWYNPAIAKLIKKSKVDVYMVKHKGAHLVNPPWTKNTFKGKIETTVEKILTPIEIKDMTEDEINQVIKEHLTFNSHAYNEVRKMKVKLNSIDNLESVIYRCPVCGKYDLESIHHALYCPNCQSTFEYTVYGSLGSYRIDQLYRAQEQEMKKLIDSDEPFLLKANVLLEGYVENRVKQIGLGEISLSRDEYLFKGIVNGKDTTYSFHPRSIPSLPTDLGINIQIYDESNLYQFVFDDNLLPTQFVIAGEYLYKKYNHIK